MEVTQGLFEYLLNTVGSITFADILKVALLMLVFKGIPLGISYLKTLMPKQ